MVLIFDISSNIAMFRKPYTTTSLISYPFPPPTAVAGLLGAMTGLDNQADSEGAGSAAFWDYMTGTRIAIGLKKPLRWLTTTINLIKFKNPNGDMSEHIQAKHQMVKDPVYRIYVSGGDIYNELKRRLENDEFVYTPYLGVAYALADIEYIGEFEEKTANDNYADTIIPVYGNVVVDIKKSISIHKELAPYRMNCKRGAIQTVSVFYPEYQLSKKLWMKDQGDVQITQVGEERVAWFEAW